MALTDTASTLADRVLTESYYVNLCHEEQDDGCLSLLTPHEAWQNLVLPLRAEDGTAIFATTVETLTSAIELVQSKVETPFRFVLCEVRPLEQFIAQRYHFEGIEIEDDRAELHD